MKWISETDRRNAKMAIEIVRGATIRDAASRAGICYEVARVAFRKALRNAGVEGARYRSLPTLRRDADNICRDLEVPVTQGLIARALGDGRRVQGLGTGSARTARRPGVCTY